MNDQNPLSPVIPEFITVHLGPPDREAQNITVSFPDYIKSVASSEIYPTWPEAALRANIYAQISFALNRVYTEYYRSRGYDFDITNSTALDQSYSYGSDVFENISQIVDEVFNGYIRRDGSVEPLFAAYCDGIRTTCDGLSQWGSVGLADQGLSFFEILKRYFGEDIEIVENAPVGIPGAADPPTALALGSVGNFVRTLQIRLNRISNNFPAIPKIYPVDGIFGEETEEAVKAFQRIFDLTVDGIVGNATWFRVLYYYTGVKRLNDLYSEGITYDEISQQFENELRPGSSGPAVLDLQFLLAFIAEFVASISEPPRSGFFEELTEASVKSFQESYGLPVTGVVDIVAWDLLHDTYVDAVRESIASFEPDRAIPFPGNILSIGANNPNVSLLKSYINFLSTVYPEVPPAGQGDYYDQALADSVSDFQRLFQIPVTGVTDIVTWTNIANAYNDLIIGYERSQGQYPGYNVGEGER